MTTLGGYSPNIVENWADAVSASGYVIAGSWTVPNPDSISGSDSHAMIWTQSTGPVELQEALMSGGATGLEGWILETLSDVSGNGQWVVEKESIQKAMRKPSWHASVQTSCRASRSIPA